MKHIKTVSVPFILLYLFIQCFSHPILAQQEQDAKQLSEMNLEDLLNMEVTTASKKAEKTSDAPGIITTITSEEIKYFGANSIYDILERATSIQPMSSHFYQSNNSIMRGDLRTQYDNHILILINGRPIREGVTGGINSPVYTSFPVDMIQRIEIVRGPGSVLYGSNAFVGVVNIITKTNDNTPSLNVRGTFGSFGTISGSVTGNYSTEDFKAKVGAKLDNITGWDFNANLARPGAPNQLANRKYGQKNLGVTADVSYKDFSLVAFLAHNKHDGVGVLPYIIDSGVNTFDRLFLNAGYTFKLNDSWDASVNLTHNGTTLVLGDDPSNHHSSADYLAELTLNGKLGDDFNFVFGGVVDSRNKNNAEVVEVIAPYHLTQLSTYIQADYRPVNSLKLILGAQLNKPQDRSWDFVPRIGAIYNITDEIGLKTLYGQAFRTPWPTEQLIHASTLSGNNDLNPEKIGTLDIQIFFKNKTMDASITYYMSKYTNSITRAPLPNKPTVATYINQGELNMKGFEAECKASVSSNIFVTASATYQNNSDEDIVPIYVPKFMAKVGAFYSLNNYLTVGLFNTLFGKPKENKGAILNPEAKTVNLLDININYKLPVTLPLELNVYIKNLLGSDYYYTEFVRGWVNTIPVDPGMALYGTIGLRF